MKRRTYGYDRVKLATHYTADELSAWREELVTDPANANTEPGSIYLLNAVTRKRVENIAWAIATIQRERARGAA